jgi:hypothetical protein
MVDRDRVSGRRTPAAARPRRRPANLYQSVVDNVAPGALAAAARVEGLDDEVALVRVLLQRALAEHPENLELLIKGMHLLVRMVVAQYNLTGAEAAQLEGRMAELAGHFAAAIFREEAADG